ncbi:MAG: addiction module protein, partial [Pyrinomonadaceae bacterium]
NVRLSLRYRGDILSSRQEIGMSSNAEKILQEALNLTPQDRAEVLERLLATFQEPPDPEIDKLWAQEAEDRIDAYDRGELGSVSAEEVFARIERH